MDSRIEWVIPLAEAADSDERFIGGKAAKLAQLARAGFRVPDGFCITAAAYEHFLEEGNLANVIRMELGRKPFESMRWEEIWDTALRVRSAFLATPIPATVSHEIGIALEKLGADKAVAVRSSAPGEDSAHRSFAGLHESLVGLVSKEAVLDAVRLVWASLWSDAALLYRHELSLDPARSRMAVIVPEVITEDRSGVAFGRDPRDAKKDRVIVEAVPGPCSDLVDGAVDPDRWILKRSSGEVLEWRHGDRENEDSPAPILEANDLNVLYHTLMDVESLFERAVLADDRLLGQRTFQTNAELLIDDWFGEIVMRPHLDRLDGALDGPVGGHHDYGCFGCFAAQDVQQLKAVPSRHVDVTKDQIRRLAVDDPHRPAERCGYFHFVAFESEKLA